MLSRRAPGSIDKRVAGQNPQSAPPQPRPVSAPASTSPPKGISRGRDRASGGDAGAATEFALRWPMVTPRGIQAGSAGGPDHATARGAPRHHAQHASPGYGP